MRAFGEAFCVYRPPIDTKSVNPVIESKSDGQPQIVLNFITPHQKWGIHSTYSDNLMMLTLNRGGPVVWISETDAAKAELVDNDWVEVYNVNGAISARVVVSQRMKDGTIYMYHAQEKDREHTRLSGNRSAWRHPQLGHTGHHQTDPHDRGIRSIIIRIQLLRNSWVKP